MKSRPIPLIIFAVLQFLVPAFSLVFNALLSGIPLATYTQLFVETRSSLELVEFFAFFPLAGMAILAMKSWSYPVYLGVVAWTIATNAMIWATDYSGSLMTLVAANAFNLLCVAYYMHPKVRAMFMDSKLRWWETSPRFKANIDGVLINNDIRKDCEIVNISEGGALLKTHWQPQDGEQLNLNFELQDRRVDIDAKVVHANENGFGVEFVESRRPSAWDPSTINSALKLLDLPLHNPPESFGEQLSQWVNQMKQGKGFVPNL